MSGSHKADLRVRVDSVDLRVDGVSDTHILATATQSCSGMMSVWHGDDLIWTDHDARHMSLGYGEVLHVPRWLALSTASGEEREWDMARDNIPEVWRASKARMHGAINEDHHIREIVSTVRGEARFRIRTVTMFTGAMEDEEARTIINRAASSVQREPDAYGLDAWPSGLHWRDVAREIYEGWKG